MTGDGFREVFLVFVLNILQVLGGVVLVILQ